MFDDVPLRFWILLLLVVLAWTPARYVFDHIAHDPRRRDITQAPEDLSWRSTGALARSAALLLGIIGLAIFIFTPAAAEFARSPSFLPLIMAVLGIFSTWSVIKSYTSGDIEPMVRGVSWRFNRSDQPKRYWISMVWNGLLGALFIFLSYKNLEEAAIQPLRDACYNWDKPGAATQAITACGRLLAEHADDNRSFVLNSRASAYYTLDNYSRAEADYRASIRLDPNNSAANYNLGLVYAQFGQSERAIWQYTIAIRLDPNDATHFETRGLAYLDRAQFDRAIADFTAAQKLQPENLDHVANRGLSYVWKGDRVRAEQDFALVRSKAPSSRTLLHGEAVLALQRNDVAEAIRALSDAIAGDSGDVWALEKRARLYRRLGEAEKARADMAAVRRLSTTDTRIE